MKKFLLSLAVLFTATFSANAQVVDTTPICGSYTSDFYLALGSPVAPEDIPVPGKVVLIEPGTEAGTINFKLNEFTMGSGEVSDSNPSLGNIELLNITVNKEGDIYTFADKDYSHIVLGDGAIEADVKLNSTTSNITNNVLTANVDIIWTNGGNYPIFVRLISQSFTSGIESLIVDSKQQTSGVYTLDGRYLGKALNASAPKGVYIVNGKKVLK